MGDTKISLALDAFLKIVVVENESNIEIYYRR